MGIKQYIVSCLWSTGYIPISSWKFQLTKKKRWGAMVPGVTSPWWWCIVCSCAVRRCELSPMVSLTSNDGGDWLQKKCWFMLVYVVSFMNDKNKECEPTKFGFKLRKWWFTCVYLIFPHPVGVERYTTDKSVGVFTVAQGNWWFHRRRSIMLILPAE